MKRIIIASLLVSATQAFAAPAATAANARLVNADSSPLSAICIAAVESRLAAFKVAAPQGLTYEELDQVYCNGMPLIKFVRTMRASDKKAG